MIEKVIAAQVRRALGFVANQAKEPKPKPARRPRG
jgi:hypothetical protein